MKNLGRSGRGANRREWAGLPDRSSEAVVNNPPSPGLNLGISTKATSDGCPLNGRHRLSVGCLTEGLGPLWLARVKRLPRYARLDLDQELRHQRGSHGFDQVAVEPHFFRPLAILGLAPAGDGH